jgi:hypothetical protein
MNIIPMINKVLSITNSMIGETTLPDFGFATNQRAERVRISALN